MHAAFVVMAAGLGSRYGGVKQMEGVGPDGEILMEYSIYDALKAGFDRIVLIIKPEMLDAVKHRFGDRIARAFGAEICYAFQRMEGDWEGIPIPKARTKPLGTVHALLSAREYLDRPFAAVNADDFYGAGAVNAVAAALPGLSSPDQSVMAAYRLENTVSPFGSVTRGVCTVEGALLKKVTETYHILPTPDGAIRDTTRGMDGPAIPPDTPVSMNFWGFHAGILNRMDEVFSSFLQDLDPADNKQECLLPVLVDREIAAGRLRCRALTTDDRWFGLTYSEDKAGVAEQLRRLHAQGVYPPALWG